MQTIIGAIFVIAMLILAAAFIYFLVRGTTEATEAVEETEEEIRAQEHLPEPGTDITPPSSGLVTEAIPKGARIPEEESPERAVPE
ncbi:MAG: hypothetical protein M5U01_30595 [Ardenticatenaceae bacterium]|nr:hypothetical protein [Ardenticatenaceae bacterium]HBY99534.1 hypothetical protein [Chloroflexota bacterium]